MSDLPLLGALSQTCHSWLAQSSQCGALTLCCQDDKYAPDHKIYGFKVHLRWHCQRPPEIASKVRCTLLKVWKWLASKCVTEVNVAQGLYIHWSTVKHSAEKLQAASMKLVEGSRRVCSRRLWNIHRVTRTQSHTGLACLVRLHNNTPTQAAAVMNSCDECSGPKDHVSAKAWCQLDTPMPLRQKACLPSGTCLVR